MKILYGIQATGNGHATRSEVIIKQLESLGHKVDILTSGNFRQIKVYKAPKYQFKGISFKFNKDGSISYLKTLLSIKYFSLFKNIIFKEVKNYDLIITDYEPITAWSAKYYGKKVIGIGNQYAFRCKKLPRPKKKSMISEFFLRWFAPTKNYIAIGYDSVDANFIQPIVNKVLSKSNTKEFCLVYLPSFRPKEIKEKLVGINKEFKVYSPFVRQKYITENVEFNPINKEDFSNSFKQCDSIICAAGFQTTSEALIANKKMYVVPTKNQYEQECNCESLEKIGVYCNPFFRKYLVIDWLNMYSKIDYKWEDPINEVIDRIISYSENH